MRWLRFMTMVLLVGCSEEPTDVDPTCEGDACTPAREPCGAGQVEVGEACEPAGLPLGMPCEPGQVFTDPGCEPAGVAVDGCGLGFVHDGVGSCDPVLPEELCAPGQIAIPGDESCRELASCGTEPFPQGDFDVYVDDSFVGTSDGTMAAPWTTVQQAVDAAQAGARIAVAAGTYPGDVVITDKTVALVGVCPQQVEIRGAGGVAAVLVTGAAGFTMADVAVTGPEMGLLVSDSLDVEVDRVWIHDTAGRGLDVEDSQGPSSATITDSLIEDNGEGSALLGVETRFVRSVLRPRNVLSIADAGRGLNVHGGSVSLSRTVVEQAVEVGIAATAAAVSIDESVIRFTAATADAELGWALFVRDDAGGPATLDIKRSVIVESALRAIAAMGADVTIDATTVGTTRAIGEGAQSIRVSASVETARTGSLVMSRSTIANVAGLGLVVVDSSAEVRGVRISRIYGMPGWGAFFARARGSVAKPVIDMRESIVEDASDVGVAIFSAETTLVASAIVGTKTRRGRGVDIESFDGHEPAAVHIDSCLVANHVEHGIYGYGNEITIERTQVQDVLGRGVEIDEDLNNPRSTVGTLRGVAIERVREFGLYSQGGQLTLERCVIRDVAADDEGRFGDGVLVKSADTPGSGTFTGLRIENSARVAVASFGSAIELSESELVCQAIDLNGEPSGGNEDIFVDGGDNHCGCPDASSSCKLQSATIEAPAPLDPLGDAP